MRLDPDSTAEAGATDAGDEPTRRRRAGVSDPGEPGSAAPREAAGEPPAAGGDPSTDREAALRARREARRAAAARGDAPASSARIGDAPRRPPSRAVWSLQEEDGEEDAEGGGRAGFAWLRRLGREQDAGVDPGADASAVERQDADPADADDAPAAGRSLRSFGARAAAWAGLASVAGEEAGDAERDPAARRRTERDAGGGPDRGTDGDDAARPWWDFASRSRRYDADEAAGPDESDAAERPRRVGRSRAPSDAELRTGRDDARGGGDTAARPRRSAPPDDPDATDRPRRSAQPDDPGTTARPRRTAARPDDPDTAARPRRTAARPDDPDTTARPRRSARPDDPERNDSGDTDGTDSDESVFARMGTLLRPSGEEGQGVGERMGRWLSAVTDRSPSESPAVTEPLPRPVRSAAAARRRAEVSAARRRNEPALWVMRIVALAVVALMLVALALLVGALA